MYTSDIFGSHHAMCSSDVQMFIKLLITKAKYDTVNDLTRILASMIGPMIDESDIMNRTSCKSAQPKPYQFTVSFFYSRRNA